METEKLSETKDLNSIKLIRGQRGNYGWEIKLVGDDEKEIIGKLKDVDEELNKTYTKLNFEGGKI
jgi:hypothetical protein